MTQQPRDPGVYFSLSEDEYHRDPSLGSTDEKDLAKNPSTYWFHSWMNPEHPEDDRSTPAKVRGSAVHVLVLYGEAEFDRRYMRGADHTADMSPAEKGAATKAANAKAAAKGLIALPAKVYDNVAIASAMIAKNPKLATALTGGMNEVSLFWRDPVNKLPKKARIDCLKPRGIGDLKSLANKYDKEFRRACLDSVVNYDYHVQAKHYMNGRAQLSKLVADGCVHGDHDADLLKRACAAKEWAWQFVWWQAEGAPITYSRIISPANPILEVAAGVIARADNNYIEYMKEFGPGNMWLLQEEPSELYIEDLPPWFGR
jgi:hypothetical protein